MITPLLCSLVGVEQRVRIVPGTMAARLYRADAAIEAYFCNYGVNPAYHAPLERAGLVLSGVGESGELRIIELAAHPFFLATLFLPQIRSRPERPHPVLAGFAAAVKSAMAARTTTSALT